MINCLVWLIVSHGGYAASLWLILFGRSHSVSIIVFSRFHLTTLYRDVQSSPYVKILMYCHANI